ncbi:MAG: cytidylate kinase family protein [Deltaproteobacteria bacterium]|nr:cytidylate kinase family protein [Deltaproteobacteria bacterium]
MPIVLITSPPHGMGHTLAENLADKTGWPIYSREQLAEEAHTQGIKLGRLETSIIKSPIISEKLAREKELYLSFVTDTICGKMENNNLIYSGRSVHFLFSGVSHILRVGLGVPMEIRITNASKQLGLSLEKAMDYIKSIDADVEKWVNYVHREKANDPSYYDLFLNIGTLSLSNATELLKTTAELPDFQLTDKSLERLEDLHLAARARLHLARNKETAGLNLGVRARNKVVTVTYMPRQEAAAESISQALQNLEDCMENQCTMAETNILFIQEHFNPKTDDFHRVTQLAKRWGAAVELLRLIPKKGTDETPQEDIRPEPLSANHKDSVTYTGGVEDDGPEINTDNGLSETLEELVSMGRSAGGYTVAGAGREVINTVKENNNYSLVILGDLFLSKGSQTSTRLTRELGLTLHDKLRAPVININELQSKFLFGKAQALKLLLFSLIALCVYGLVFTFQKPILNVLGGDLHEQWKWLAAAGVVVFVPFIAYTYGTISGLILKLIDID